MTQFLAILVILGVVIGVLCVLLRPHWAFVLVLSMWPLEQLLTVYFPFLTRHSSLINVATGVLAILALATRMGRGESLTSGYWNTITKLTVLMYILWALSALWSPTPNVGRDTIPFASAYLGLLLVLLPMLVADIADFRRMLTGFMLVGSIVAILIVINPRANFASGRLILDLGFVGHGIQRHGNPLALADMGGMLAVTAALIRPQKIGPAFNLLRAAAFISGMGIAIASGSRGQVLAAVVVGVLMFPLARRLANPKQFVLAVVGLGVVVFGFVMMFRTFIGRQNEARWDPIQMLADSTGRWEMVKELMDAYLASPAHWPFGLGMLAYTSISRAQHVNYVHNVAADALFEHGLVGGAIFVMAFVLSLKYSKRLWKIHCDDTSLRSTITVLIGLSIFSLFISLKQGNIAYPAPFFWWIIIGKLCLHESRVQQKSGAAGAVGEWNDEDNPDGPVPEPELDARPLEPGKGRPDYAIGY